MTPDDIVTCLNTASLTHLLAVDAAVATMRNLPADDPARIALKIGLQNARSRARSAHEQYEATLDLVATEMAEPRRYPGAFTVDETQSILAEHYPWALK